MKVKNKQKLYYTMTDTSSMQIKCYITGINY